MEKGDILEFSNIKRRMKKEKTKEKVSNPNKKISKEIEKKVSTKTFINLLIAILIMAYFCVISVIYKNVLQGQIIHVVKVATLAFLAITLVLIEFAYKKESKRLFIHSMEALLLATHSLTTMHIIKIYNFDFQNYILFSSYVFSIYYVLKTIIINTKARRDYLKSLSDIPEIVQKEEPRKKEAFKKEKIEKVEVPEKTEIIENTLNEEKDEDENKEKGKKENKKVKSKKFIKKEIKEEAKQEVEKSVKKEKEKKTKTNAEEKIEKDKNETSKSKIANLRAKLEMIEKEEKKEKEDKKVEENLVQEKPKRKRGRPKKEVKVND